VAAACIHDDELPSAVHFKAAGETLEGLVVGDGPTGIVLAPQLDEDLCEWKPYAYALAALGYRVIAFTSGTHTRAGVVAAAGVLRAMGSTHVILIGASKGGTAVLAAAPVIRPRVSAVVDISGPASIDDVNAASDIGQLTMPILFVVGRLDAGYAQDTRTLYKRATASHGRRLLLLPGTQHGVDLVNGSTQQAIDAFLRAHAG
jgi:dienelactone hydrolase